MTTENTPETTTENIIVDPAQTKTAADQQDEPKKVLVIEENLRRLIDELKEQKALVVRYQEKEDMIAECAFKALDVVGLVDKTTGQLVAELKSGDGVMDRVMQAVKDNFSITEMLMSPTKFASKMADKFSFFKVLEPIFTDYAQRKGTAA